MEQELKLGDVVVFNANQAHLPQLVITKLFDNGILQLTFYNDHTRTFEKIELPKEAITKIGR